MNFLLVLKYQLPHCAESLWGCKGTLATVDNRSDIDPVVKDVCLFVDARGPFWLRNKLGLRFGILASKEEDGEGTERICNMNDALYCSGSVLSGCFFLPALHYLFRG